MRFSLFMYCTVGRRAELEAGMAGRRPELYRRMLDDMDINCGDILDGVSIEDKGKEIFEMILRVASGEKTKSELLGYGDNEFVPWQIGATM